VVVDAGSSRARWIPASHNCPGFPFGVAGNELLGRFRAQALKYGVPIINARVDSLAAESGQFVASDGQTTWRAKTVILATGVVDRLPQIEGVENAIGTGVIRLCAVCDGYEARDEVIGVYGLAPVAIGHAEFLRTFSRKVVVIESGVTSGDGGTFKARAETGGLQWYPPGSLLSVTDTGCQVRFESKSVHLDTVYPVLGADAQSSLGAKLGAAVDSEGNFIVAEGMQTSVPGLHAIGDVVVGLNQISVAVGQAAAAACAIHRSLPLNPK
jgi:thioredoxin reductase (NADPH)